MRMFKGLFASIKKAFIVFMVFYVILAAFSYSFSRNKPNINVDKFISEAQKPLYESIKKPEFETNQVAKVSLVFHRALICSFIGELCTDTPPTTDQFFKSSIIGKVTTLISLPYINPPASGTYWATDSLQKAGLLPSAYAAEGIGFASIKPLMNIWKIFRDIAYLVIVLILVAIGFMIMFRMKVNPQTVISVENALPKIVVTLLLITFSFPIAGFLVDIMYVLIVLAISILSSNNTFYDVAQTQNYFLQSDFKTLWEAIIPLPSSAQFLYGMPRFAYIGDSMMALLPTEINTWSRILLTLIGAIYGTKAISGIVEAGGIKTFLSNISIAGFGIGKITEPIFGVALILLIVYLVLMILIHGFGLILGFVISLAITGMLFNIFFMLLKSYIQITVSIVFSPIIILFEALPGKSTFSFWLKGLIGELLTFPVIITLLLVEKIMFLTMTYPGDFWNPPFLFQLNPGAFSVIFGMGLILITPDIVKLVKEGVGAKPLPFNIGLGTFFSGGGAVVGGGMGILQQFSTINLGTQAISQLTGRFMPGKPPVSGKDLENVPGAAQPIATGKVNPPSSG